MTMTKLPELSEDAIQRAVFQHFAHRSAPGVFAFHPKNGGIHQAGRSAGINSALGVVTGIPDVIVTRGFSSVQPPMIEVYALELKRESRRGKKQTPHEIEQEKTRKRMAECGWIVGITYGLDDTIWWLEASGLLIGEAK
jgi:hypothetical protein